MSQLLTPPSLVGDILGAIAGNITSGWTSFRIVKAMQEGFRSNQIPNDSWLYHGFFEGCKRETLMALARLMVDHPGATSVIHLLNYSNSHPNEFRFSTPAKVNQAVKHDRDYLENCSLLPKLKELRDRCLAHTDKDHVTNPQAVYVGPVDLEEIKDTYQVVLAILNTYKGFYDNSEFRLTNIDESIDRDMAHLIRLLGGG